MNLRKIDKEMIDDAFVNEVAGIQSQLNNLVVDGDGTISNGGQVIVSPTEPVSLTTGALWYQVL